MDISKIGSLVIGIVVAALLLTTILVPVISSSGDAMYETFTNEASTGSGIATWERFIVDGEDDATFETVYNNNYDFKLVINGEPTNFIYASGAFITTDQCRLNKNGWYFQMFDSTGLRVENFDMRSANLEAQYTASTGEFTVTTYTDLTNTEVENTYTYTVEKYIVYLSPHGDYLATYLDGNNSVYATSDDQIVSGGAYTTGELDTSYFAQGTTVSVGAEGYTASATLDTEAVSGYVDLMQGTTQTITVTSGGSSETFTPYTAYVPEYVKAITDTNSNVMSILGLVPLLVTVGILVAAVGTIFIRRE